MQNTTETAYTPCLFTSFISLIKPGYKPFKPLRRHPLEQRAAWVELRILCLAERNDIHLRPRSEAERHRATHSQRHIQHRAAFGILASPFVIGPLHRREVPYLDLSGVSMSAQGERYVGLMQHAFAPMGGVMAEQYLENAVAQVAHGKAQIALTAKRRLAYVLYTDKGYLLIAGGVILLLGGIAVFIGASKKRKMNAIDIEE